MKFLEIIEVRATEIDYEKMIGEVYPLLDEFKIISSVKIYENVRSGTDWSIHLQHESEKLDMWGSELAVKIKEILRKFGIVNHSIWLEQY